MKCPKSGIFVNNYRVALFRQRNFAGYHSSFLRTVEIYFGQRWLSLPLEEIGPHACDHIHMLVTIYIPRALNRAIIFWTIIIIIIIIMKEKSRQTRDKNE